ncbi:MAG: hypothetical protein O7G30_14205 [Proteobacteria bacterium]|nr:hypothetical protein [Pseudomonadota bacterium]
MTESTEVQDEAGTPPRKNLPLWQKLLPWLITAACFAFLYTRLDAAAGREGQSLAQYLGGVFGKVSWPSWLALMIPYSLFFFLVDSAVVWRAINWFNTKVRYRDILPIRGSSYILSILNEQVGKGAMAVYLNRRDGVPGWEVGSSMLFIMFCEFYYLLAWATLGYFLRGSSLPDEFSVIPYVAVAAMLLFVLFHAFFSGRIIKGGTLRQRPIFRAFREARAWQYGALILIRSPAMIGAVLVYTLALRLFGIEIEFGTMLGYLPLIFFGAATPGPMRSVAITLWVVLFPGNEGEMTAFGFVQHNFFIFFNAAIGLLFLRRANRELFGTRTPEPAP